MMKRTILGISMTVLLVLFLLLGACSRPQPTDSTNTTTSSTTTATKPGTVTKPGGGSIPSTSAEPTLTTKPPELTSTTAASTPKATSVLRDFLIEDWENVKSGTYVPDYNNPTYIQGIGPRWYIWDTVSFGLSKAGKPSSLDPNKAEIVAQANGNKYIKITSTEHNFGLDADMENFPLMKGAKLSFEASGQLEEKHITHTIGIKFRVEDGKKQTYGILYKFWPINNIGDLGEKSSVIPLNSSSRTYLANLYGDFLRFKGFEPNGAVIRLIQLYLEVPGWATLDNLRIDWSDPAVIKPSVTDFGIGGVGAADSELKAVQTGASLHDVEKGIKSSATDSGRTIVSSDINPAYFTAKLRAIYTLNAYTGKVLAVNDTSTNPWPPGMMFNITTQAWEYTDAAGIHGNRGF